MGVSVTAATAEDEQIELLRSQLLACIHPEPSIAPVHLQLVSGGQAIGSTKTQVHCYAPTLDANGRLRTTALAEFLRERVLRFVIPKKTIQAAEDERVKSGAMHQYIRIHERAKGAFTTITNSGEGGEFLLFALAEKEFGLAQILCKMSLKTSTSMHYHGTDGIFAEVDSQGWLNLFWGESKLYNDPTRAITDCLKSLAPHLHDQSGASGTSSQDIVLLNEYADLGDDAALKILKRFLDPGDPQSLKAKICGIALVTFDDSKFPAPGAVGSWSGIQAHLQQQVPKWAAHASKRITSENLAAFEMHFIFVPMHRAEDFRAEFLKALA